MQEVEGIVGNETAAVELWLKEFKSGFQAKSQAYFGGISCKIERKLQDIHNLQSSFEARIRKLWADIQDLQKEVEPAVLVFLLGPGVWL